LNAASHGTSLHLVWEDDRENSMQIFYKRTVDDGVTWEQDVKLSDLTTQTLEPMPRLAVDGRNVLVVFSNRTGTGEHLFYVRSVDEGAHFTNATQLTNDLGDQSNPVVAFVGSNVHIVWQNYLQGQAQIVYLRSLDAGLTWESQILLTATNALDRHPAIFAYGEKVFVAWSRNVQGVEAVFSRASYDSGASWQPETQLSNYEPSVFLEFPSLGSNGTFVHVVWNGAGVIYARSKDAGATWDPVIPITNATREYLAPRISVSGSLLRVVSAAILTQGRNITSDVFYLESGDGGNRWSGPIVLTSHGPKTLSLAPAISSQGDATFVAWEDDRNSRFAVFWASKPDFIVLSGLKKQLLASVETVLVAAVFVFVVFELKRSGRMA
jgi:hypothetical protein